MNIIQALILGAIQGLTEFIPISSSGHLIVFPNLLGWEAQPLAFDTTLHLGTALGLIVFFWKDITEMVIGNRRMGWLIVAGSVPAAILGFLFEEQIELMFRSVNSVASILIVGSLLMFVAERMGNWVKNKDIDLRGSVIVGLFQSLALLPGFSRSGATISGGMLLGLSREKAARFSFLLSIPIVVGAGLFKVIDSAGALDAVGTTPLAVGFFSSFLVGLFAIKFMLNFLKDKGLNAFIVYRIVLALFLLFIAI